MSELHLLALGASPLPDFWKSIALTRMRTMVGIGGTLRLADIVYSFTPSEAAPILEQWCATLAGPREQAND